MPGATLWNLQPEDTLLFMEEVAQTQVPQPTCSRLDTCLSPLTDTSRSDKGQRNSHRRCTALTIKALATVQGSPAPSCCC